MIRTALVLATSNAGKTREFARLLGDVFDVRTMPDSVTLPEEDGRTFAANARIKGEAAFLALGGMMAVMADDSGLEVAALDGRPGVLSARFAGEGAGDEANVARLLRELFGRSDREARFVCSLCLLLPSGQGSEDFGRFVEADGISRGTITLAPRGTDGFGYDPVFQPDGWTMTLAEASPDNKDRVSHRGAAARSLLARLAEQGPVTDGS